MNVCVMGEAGEVGSAANSLVFLKKKYEIWRKGKILEKKQGED